MCRDAENPKHQFWTKLKNLCTTTLREYVPQNSTIAYFDYPVHSNIGDILIWKGTEQWIRESGLDVVDRRNILEKNLPDLPPDAIVVCHGGGNFGDIYNHQKYRERIVSRYPNQRIVILPQTIHFHSESQLLRSASVLSRHHDLIILARDRKSLKIAQNHFSSNSRLCPDMATFLYPLSAQAAPSLYSHTATLRRLCLLRKDVEQPSQPTSIPSCGWKGDWNDIAGWKRLLPRMAQLGFALNGPALARKTVFRFWSLTSDLIVSDAIRHFSRYSSITTSRMHGMILGTLLGLDVDLIDNSYGKNIAYLKEWYNDYPGNAKLLI